MNQKLIIDAQTNPHFNQVSLLFQCLTSKIVSSMDFAQKSEAILKFWTSIHKNTDNAKNLEELRNNIKTCIR